jgi:hypothetical protein
MAVRVPTLGISGALDGFPDGVRLRVALPSRTTRAIVFTTIKDILDHLPKAYSKELFEQKCDVVITKLRENEQSVPIV